MEENFVTAPANFNESEINDLRTIIRKEIQKRGGYTHEITLNEVEIRGENFIKVETDSIQIMPAIFDELHIDAYGSISKMVNAEDEAEDVEVYRMWIPLTWRYTTYEGGSNGVKLKDLYIRMFRHASGYTSMIIED